MINRISWGQGFLLRAAFVALGLAVASGHRLGAEGRTATLPPGVQRVVMLGDSITYAGAYVNYLETYFVTRHPDRAVEFIDVGLSSETVSGLTEPGHAGGKYLRPDLHERLARVLAQTKPDLVFACYGMNDGIYQPFDEERFQKFQDGMRWLHGEVAKAGVPIIHVTPPTYDPAKGKYPFYNAVLDRYSAWLLEQRAAGWQVIDVHGPMNRALAERRQREPEFAYTKDGIHPGELGHWVMAQQILLYLGAADIADTPDGATMAAVHPRGAQVLKLVEQRQAMMKNAWLLAIGHKRPGVTPGLPLAEAQAKAAELEKQIRALVQPAP